jgi:DUF971 family protein
LGHTRAVSFDLPDSEAPTDVELDRTAGLTLHWVDGSSSHFGLEELRRNCPCAECRGLREQGVPVGPKPRSLLPFTAIGAELIGGWGLTINWSDGHGTGIFAWSILRAWQTPTPGTTPTPDPVETPE